MKFYIYSPPLTNNISNGIHALHQLCNNINSLNYTCSIINWGDTIQPNTNDIIIYPEVIQGNPLNFKHIVRYMLNREGYILGNTINQTPDDYILTWSNLYTNTYHSVLNYVSLNEFEIFNDANTKPVLQRNLDCTYIGKGSSYTDCNILPDTIEINRNNPINKYALADLLKSTRILYTYDPITLVNLEAILSGALVCILNYIPYNKEEWQSSDLNLPTITVENNNIVIPKSYNLDRKHYINTIKSNSNNYINNLHITIKKILKHFNL